MKEFLLTIDCGNTNSKAAILNQNLDLIVQFPFENLNSIITKYELNRNNTIAAVSSVTTNNIIIPFKTFFVSSYFKKSKFLNMPVHYSQTLGEDRLIQAWYLFSKYNKKMILIDTGTFSTLDFIDIKGLNGGIILPGLKTISDTYQFGENLKSYKELNLSNYSNRKIPSSTIEAIEAGVFLTFISPIKAVVRENFDYELILTGGNCELLAKHIDFENMLYPHLIFKSLGLFAQRICNQ